MFAEREAAAYLAAMIDGEGTVAVYRYQKSCRGIHIVNTELELIEACEECCRILSIPYHRYIGKQLKFNWKIKMTISISNRVGLTRALEVLPIRSARKLQRLREAVESYREPPPSKEVLEDLYINGKLSLTQVGVKFNTNASTVRQWLQKYNIARRFLSASVKLDWMTRRHADAL